MNTPPLRATAEPTPGSGLDGPAVPGNAATSGEVLCLECRAPLDPAIKRDKNYCFSCAVHVSCACADD